MEQLLAHYEKPVYNAAIRILGDANDAADVTQTTFLKVFMRLEQYKPNYSFFSWVYRIAVNESIDQLKHKKKQQPLDGLDIAGSHGPESRTEAENLFREVQRELMKLKEKYRVVIMLRHFADCNYSQISEILQIPEKRVKSRIYSARQLLRASLLSRGIY
jgi:RNA polymerase sigma-70 factor (ECF subfamily)